MTISQRTKTVRLQQNIARGVIYLSAGLTIFFLVWIIGYIMYRGFYSDNRVAYDVTPYEEEIVSYGGEEIIFIANKKVKVYDLTFSDIQRIYSKVRPTNWGFNTHQDIKVHPFAYIDGDAFSDTVEEFINRASDRGEWRGYVERVGSPDGMIDRVARTEGGVGFIPASAKDLLNKKVRIIPIRRMSLAVNSSITQTVNNVSLQEVTEKELEAIIEGRLSYWNIIGGNGHIPIKIEDPDPAVAAEKIMAEKDAFAIYPYYEAVEREIEILPVERRETGSNLTLSFLFEKPSRSGQWGGISYIIINTFFLILFTLLFSTPIGVMAAVFLVEYSRQGRIMKILRMGTETLAGIPSIVFGLFGFIFFVQVLGFGIGFISSTLTVTLMILPTIIRTSEEALKSVPQSFREGSLAMGATKLQTIFKVVIPAAIPGILTGVILGIGRTVGETAVLLYTLGSNYDLVRGPSSSARVLSLHLYMLFSEALSFDRAFATAAVLVFIILLTNFLTSRLIGRVNRMAGKK